MTVIVTAINFDTLMKRFLEVMPLLQTAYLNLVLVLEIIRIFS
jgi:hypothetical protein